jgi:ectoine hydroxylase-related dioxygenase (phytanoyl-CoA dioxygenase family)
MIRQMTTPLPRITNDLAQAECDIAEYGLCLVEGVLTPGQLDRARTALYRAAADDVEQGREQPRFALDYGDGNQRVWNVLNRDRVFIELVEHPSALKLIRAVIGWPALLGNLSANIVGPGGDASLLHADQIFVPEPWPAAPQGVNVAWCLDEFTASNGATRVVPGSHRRGRNPTPDDVDESIAVEAPLGTMMVFESRVWHRTGQNLTASRHRAGLFGWYTRPIYRTQENWFLALDPKLRETASDALLQLLAYKTEGLGLVYGRSPM